MGPTDHTKRTLGHPSFCDVRIMQPHGQVWPLACSTELVEGEAVTGSSCVGPRGMCSWQSRVGNVGLGIKTEMDSNALSALWYVCGFLSQGLTM